MESIAEAKDKAKPFLRKSEVAALFGVDPGTITRWAQEGLLPTILTLGKQRRYPRGPIMQIRAILRMRPTFDHDAQQEITNVVLEWKRQNEETA